MRLARHERYPAISVSPFVSQEDAVERETTVGLGISLPLPFSSRHRASSESASARERQARTAVEVAQRELTSQVLTAAQAYATHRDESLRWSADAIDEFRAAAALADRHYRLGAVPIGTYVELQHSYLDAVEALLATQQDTLNAGLMLQELTGLELNLVEERP